MHRAATQGEGGAAYPLRMRRFTVLAIVVAACVGSLAEAQAPPPLPPEISFVVGLPDEAAPRSIVATLSMSGLPWVIEGCVTTSSACFATRRVTLSDAQRAELVTHWSAVASMPRCEPEGFAPGDPEYSFGTPTISHRGHLPRASRDIAARSGGPCGAPMRLAWWLAQTFGRR